jgi:hypothetical protein
MLGATVPYAPVGVSTVPEGISAAITHVGIFDVNLCCHCAGAFEAPPAAGVLAVGAPAVGYFRTTVGVSC